MNKEAKRAADAPTASTTPQSSSSNSSGKTSSQNGTHSVAKFKEKRPEPLKLNPNPNPNQEIPLDLSVKSAGNAPSGLSAMFSLASASRLHSLETPSILWQDNEALLIKPRLFSTNSNATSHSALSGQPRSALHQPLCSPPATPETPFPDMLCSPAAGPRAGSANAPLSASLLQASSECSSSLQALVSAQLQQKYNTQVQVRRQIQQLGRPAAAAGGTAAAARISASTVGGHQRAPRRSCSTEELSLFAPAKGSATGRRQRHRSRFSYLTAASERPTSPAPAEGSAKATTPTSVAKATANLLNITLNSPTGTGDLNQKQAAQEARLALSSSTDPLMSTGAYTARTSANSSSSSCFTSDHLLNQQQQHQQQQQQQHLHLRQQQQQSAVAAAAAAAQHHHHHLQHHHHLLASQPTSLNSSATLNTPTLISPSQLKQHGSLSFLPSPTLSPFSSVFEMPSPLLMFQATAPQAFGGSSSGESRSSLGAGNKPSSSSSPRTTAATTCFGATLTTTTSSSATAGSDQALNRSGQQVTALGQHNQQALSEGDLAHLVTPARDKVGAAATGEHSNPAPVKMEVEEDSNLQPQQQQVAASSWTPPPAAIPRITVSGSQQPRQQAPLQVQASQQLQQKQGELWAGVGAGSQVVERSSQRDLTDKRALSPQSFKLRVSHYHGQRHESSSAPPDVCQSRARAAKVKVVDPFDNLWIGADTSGDLQQQQQHFQLARPIQQQQQQQQQQQLQQSYRPYPDIQAAGYGSNSRLTHSFHSGRSNSAEPQPSGCWPCEPQPPVPKLQPPGQQQQQLYFHHHNQQQQPMLHHQAQQPSYQSQHHHQHHQQQQQPQQQQHHYGYAGFSQSAQHLSAAAASTELGGPSTRLGAGSCGAQSVSAGDLAVGASYCQPGMLASSASQLQLANNLLQQQQQPSCESRAMSADGAATGAANAGPNHRRAEYLLAGAGFRSASAASSFSSGGGGGGGGGGAAKKYSCDQCSKAFTRSDMLTRHKRLHSGDRPFQCNECKQEFSRSDHLSTHMRTHTGEKPYKCKLCAYSACRKDMITRHMKVHNRGGSALEQQQQQQSAAPAR